MLVLSRKSEEAISIGSVAKITFVIKGNRVACIVSAPSSVSIRRGELGATSSSNAGSDITTLVLSRKDSETIVFDALGITLKICKISGNRVNVGIDAPREISVKRLELI